MNKSHFRSRLWAEPGIYIGTLIATDVKLLCRHIDLPRSFANFFLSFQRWCWLKWHILRFAESTAASVDGLAQLLQTLFMKPFTGIYLLNVYVIDCWLIFFKHFLTAFVFLFLLFTAKSVMPYVGDDSISCCSFVLRCCLHVNRQSRASLSNGKETRTLKRSRCTI